MPDLTIAWSPSSFGASDDTPQRMLEEAGLRVVPNPYGRRLTADEIVAHLDGVDGLIAGLEPLNRTVLSSAPRLKAIARVGIGMDNIDHDAARELGIAVSNTPDPPAESVAELTVTAALTLSRGLVPANDALHAGRWEKVIHPGLSGSTVLVVGFGRIGQATARRMLALGAKVLAYDPYFEPRPDLPVEPVSLDEGLERARVVSLHASGRDTILGAREMALMAPGSFILNSARGELVDEDALVAALDAGHIAGAWFDVFAEEPYTGPLTKYPQVLLTPHVGTYTERCRREMETQAVGNLLRDLGVSKPPMP